MAQVVLSEIPPLGAAFARAMVPTRGAAVRLPEHSIVISRVDQDPVRLAAYNRVCGFTLRDHVAPTWLHVLTFPLHIHLLGDKASSIRLMGAVHVSNAMTLHRPVRFDETLTLEVGVGNPRAHAKGALIDLVGQVRVGDEPVWDGVSTYLSSSAKVAGEPQPVERLPFEPGQPQALWRLPSDLGRRYRDVSGDPNLIHTNRLAAKAFGFQRPIIHGMWTHARALAALEGRLPDAYTATVGFAKPVLLPGTVGFAAAPTERGFSTAVTNRDGSKPHMLMTVEAVGR
ncbi:MaoC family dehydratase [Demequina pelophila]|uniref:MaoC family dehydratase n=1 Tax=Demequina pelophila TaxID=1638984 RepID=UPI00078290C8|nr:MaoC/PaaZ C-terminal domain-containing protein [Demequina pelophila]